MTEESEKPISAASSEEPSAKDSPDKSPETKSGEAPAPRAPQQTRSILSTILETFKYIDTCEKDKTIVFRHNDRLSVICMLSAFVIEIFLMFLFLVDTGLRHVIIFMAVIADFLFGLAILWYVLLRFGVLRSFDPRQTLLSWQLMIGAGALFAFYTMNIAFAFFTYYNWIITTPPTVNSL